MADESLCQCVVVSVGDERGGGGGGRISSWVGQCVAAKLLKVRFFLCRTECLRGGGGGGESDRASPDFVEKITQCVFKFKPSDGYGRAVCSRVFRLA